MSDARHFDREASEPQGSSAELAGALANRQWRRRHSAAAAVGCTAAPDTVNLLAGILGDPVSRVRHAAVAALARIGDAAIPALENALSGPDWRAARAASLALARIRETGCDVLVRAAANGNRAAAVGLARLETHRGDEAMEDLRAPDRQAGAARQVRSALSHIPEPEFAFARTFTQAYVAASKEDLRAEERAFEGLVALDEPAIEAMVVELEARSAENWRRRAVCAEALGEIGSPAATDPLIDALTDPQMQVRRAAVRALGELGEEAALASLVSMLGREDLLDEPVAAAEALVALGDERACPALLEALRARSPLVRERAARALVTLDARIEEAQRPWLLLALGDLAGAAALGAAVVEALLDNLVVRAVWCDRWEEGRATLVGLGDLALDPLMEALSAQDENRRRVAADILKRLGSGRPCPTPNQAGVP